MVIKEGTQQLIQMMALEGLRHVGKFIFGHDELLNFAFPIALNHEWPVGQGRRLGTNRLVLSPCLACALELVK